MSWQVIDNKLSQTFTFKSQTDLVKFLLKVAEQADSMNHHPDITVTKAFELKLDLFTHSKHAITEKDEKLAEICDEIFEDNHYNMSL